MQTSYMIVNRPLPESDAQARGLSITKFPPGTSSPTPGTNRLDFFASVTAKEVSVSIKMEESIAYMTQHLNRPVQVATLAAMVNISPSHYFALFKRHTGRAPMDYFTRLRMAEARRLLDTTTASVKEVAAALGYDDPFYFSRVFKSVNQFAPSNYRIQKREQCRVGENPPCKS